ncbi:MAG TPA: hypothetical protein VJ951_02175 [Bacteroidales bacterium]|nr:hypothetical protein [Bacteroidales bacterium]
MKCFTCALLGVVLLFPLTLFGQFYEYGQDAVSIKWSSFDSENYQIIYPVGLDSLAMDFTDKLEYFYPFHSRVLKWEHKKIPVVIHNESSFSNGVFVWAPRRLEVFTNPDPTGHPQNWMTKLALHEGRHAFQVSKLEQGITRGLSFIAGEQAVGAITGFLPMWYLEGDAVDAETRFSYTGRGRLPEFEMGIRAIMLERGNPYSYSKAILGSYKDYVPNHYELGYLLVRHGRRNYGDKFWQDFQQSVARKPYVIDPTWFSMRNYGIRSKRDYYKQALKEYTQHWKKIDSLRLGDNAELFTHQDHKHYISYHFPQYYEAGKVIALKKGLDQIPEFVIIDSLGSEQRIFRPGLLNTGRFSYRNGKIVWDEWAPDIRWSNRNFSEICLYDLNSGKSKRLKSRTRYYAPAFSHKGNRIAAIEQQTDNRFFLVILNLSGEVIEQVSAPDNQYIQQPAWMENDSSLVMTVSNVNGEYIYSYNIETGSWNKLFYNQHNDISWPQVIGDSIYFSATNTGINNIFRLELSSKNLTRLTDSRFGAFEPSLMPGLQEKVLFSSYSWRGYNVSVVDLDKIPDRLSVNVPDSLRQLDFSSTKEEKEIIKGSFDLEPKSYEPKPYRKWTNLINIHSWLPLYFNYLNPESAITPERIDVNPGLTLLSQNLLSTAVGVLGYEYSEKMHFFHTGLRLKGRVPVFEIDFTYGGLPFVHANSQNEQLQVSPDRRNFSLYSYIPLRLNTGKYITIVQPQFRYQYSSDIFPNANNTGYQSGVHRTLYRLYAGSYLMKGRRDILPRLGVTGFASVYYTPFDKVNLGSLSYSGITCYLPGVLKHQTLKLSLTSQIQEPLKYYMSNNINMPRGIEPFSAMKLSKYSADYVFPMAYPDLNIAHLLYVKRIQGAVWADYMVGKDVLINSPDRYVTDRSFFSYGADLLFDFHFLRFFFPFSAGVRTSYIPEQSEFRPEMLFSIDIN